MIRKLLFIAVLLAVVSAEAIHLKTTESSIVPSTIKNQPETHGSETRKAPPDAATDLFRLWDVHPHPALS